jgi:hypothetical protein
VLPCKTFDFVVTAGGLLPVSVSELTIKQRASIRDWIVEQIKTERRQEAVAMSRCMDGKERISFLVRAAKDNIVVDDDDVASRMQSEPVLRRVLDVSTQGKISAIDWDVNGEMAVSAYLFALGIAESETVEKSQETETDGVTQPDFFLHPSIGSS